MTLNTAARQRSPLIRAITVLAATAILATVAASQGVLAASPNQLRGVTVYGVTRANQLITFGARQPNRIGTRLSITGLRDGEVIRGIDFRAAAPTSLFALGSVTGAADRLYTIDTSTGAATAVAGGVDLTPALTGTHFGFDFNPVVDRIRVVSDAEENLRLHPDTGALAATDTALAYAPGDANAGRVPDVVGSAYSNPDQNSLTGTTLYGIDTVRDVLVLQGSRERNQPMVSPNTGLLTTVGRLGVKASGAVGFDIVGDDYGMDSTAYVALAVIQQGQRSRLYSLNLYTGRARSVGQLGIKDVVTSIAIALPDAQ